MLNKNLWDTGQTIHKKLKIDKHFQLSGANCIIKQAHQKKTAVCCKNQQTTAKNLQTTKTSKLLLKNYCCKKPANKLKPAAKKQTEKQRWIVMVKVEFNLSNILFVFAWQVHAESRPLWSGF
jgi:hypothetical protein